MSAEAHQRGLDLVVVVMGEGQDANVVLLHLFPEEAVSGGAGDGFDRAGGVWERGKGWGSPWDAGRGVGDAESGGGGGGVAGHVCRVGLESMVDGEGGETEGGGKVCEKALDEKQEAGRVGAARVGDGCKRVNIQNKYERED